MTMCNRELLSRYKDGEATPRERQRVEAHLSVCPDCQATLAAYEYIGSSIANLGNPKAPASLRGVLFARIARENGRSGGGSFWGTFFSGLALAGTAIAVVLALSMFFRNIAVPEGATLATAVSPPPEAVDVSPESPVEVQFNKPMDTRSVEKSVVITPAVTATVVWQGEKLVVKPEAGFAANTSYTLTIDSRARDLQGVPLRETVTLRFTTGETLPGDGTPTATLAAVSSAATPSPLATAVALTPSPTATSVSFDPTPAATGVVFNLLPTATSSVTPAPTPVLTTTIPSPTPLVTATLRIGYVYDATVGPGYTGDWPTHLRSRGYSVTLLDVGSESGFSLDGYNLIVVGWLSGREPAANVAKIRNVKAPVLNGYARLAESLGLGKVFDPGNPGRTIYGKTINIEGGGGALTAGFSGEVTVAADTLYRVPIISSGATLATVTDEQQGVRNAPIWTLTDDKIYFGFFYSKDGSNHNEAYWTFFDRSVDYLLGRFPPATPSPTPRPSSG